MHQIRSKNNRSELADYVLCAVLFAYYTGSFNFVVFLFVFVFQTTLNIRVRTTTMNRTFTYWIKCASRSCMLEDVLQGGVYVPCSIYTHAR